MWVSDSLCYTLTFSEFIYWLIDLSKPPANVNCAKTLVFNSSLQKMKATWIMVLRCGSTSNEIYFKLKDPPLESPFLGREDILSSFPLECIIPACTVKFTFHCNHLFAQSDRIIQSDLRYSALINQGGCIHFTTSILCYIYLYSMD